MSRNRIALGKQSIKFATGDVHSPAANNAAVVTYAAISNICHAISGFTATVTATAALVAAPSVKIEDGSGNVVFDGHLGSSPDAIASNAVVYSLVVQFPQPKKGTAGRALILTLSNPGATGTAKLSVLGHWTEMV